MHCPGNYVILTAVSTNMWDDYLVFYDSIRRITNLRIAVVVVELTEEQRLHLQTQKNIQPITFNPARWEIFKKLDKHWRQWYKPIFIQKCVEDIEPDYLLWIDVDTVVLKKLDPLFEAIEENFLVMRDYFAPATTINDPELYKKYDCPVDDPYKNQAALNSGVVGFKFDRDQHILDTWKKKVEILVKDPEAREWVRLFDQGALLWALRELDLLHLIKPLKHWNYPAEKNLYEYHTPSKDHDTADYRWPNDQDQIGGDVIEQIRMDNPDAVIAHFAGLPKLEHLCQLNNQHSIAYLRNRRGGAAGGQTPAQRVFCVGLERSGTHTIAEMLRRSSTVECWVRHEHRPCLAQEAFMKMNQQKYETEEFQERMKLYNRQDCMLLCESNHRLSFFIEDIDKATNGQSKFVLMLRNPLDLVRSRLLNFVMWPCYLQKYPGFYQFDFFELEHRFGPGSPDQNKYRIRYPEYLDSEIIDLHLWEITKTLEVALKQLRELPEARYQIVWLDNMQICPQQILQLTHSMLNPHLLRHYAEQRFGSHIKPRRPETLQWVEEFVKEHRLQIFDVIGRSLRKYGVPPGFDVLM